MRLDRVINNPPAHRSGHSLNTAIVDLHEVWRSFDDATVVALRGVTFSVHPGEFVAIVGPSGCGKSTLLNLVGALDVPTSGTVRLDGTDLAATSDLASLRAHTVGFVFQSFNLLPTLTALENVQMPMFEMPWSRARRLDRAASLLESLGLGHRLHSRPATLSGGERQRVAIARSLANEPKLLLADEPTGNLDSESARQVMDLIEGVHRSRALTLIVVTHDPVVADRAPRQLQMLDGRLAGDTASARAE